MFHVGPTVALRHAVKNDIMPGIQETLRQDLTYTCGIVHCVSHLYHRLCIIVFDINDQESMHLLNIYK